MVISLSKGGSVSLTQEAGPAGLTSVMVGLGWDVSETPGVEYDLDASALALGPGRKARTEDDFVFFNHLVGLGGLVRHSGDVRDGEVAGDDETILIPLAPLPVDVQSILILVSVHDEHGLGLDFGQVDNAYVRVVNTDDDRELARFDLTEGAGDDVALVFGELYREGQEWKFQAVGDGYPGLAEILALHGLDAE
jgi:tellurium resistance protein TerD